MSTSSYYVKQTVTNWTQAGPIETLGGTEKVVKSGPVITVTSTSPGGETSKVTTFVRIPADGVVKNMTNRGARLLIAARVPFATATGNFRGEAHTPGRYVYSGQCPRAYVMRGELEQADYVVYSYSTPIAWHLPDGWVIPDVSYSITTSGKHQSQLYGLGEMSAKHLPSVHDVVSSPTAARYLKLIRAGYRVDVLAGKSRKLYDMVVATGEARWSEDGQAILPTYDA